MKIRKKYIVLALIAAVVLAAPAFELVMRVRYYFYHHGNSAYLFAGLGRKTQSPTPNPEPPPGHLTVESQAKAYAAEAAKKGLSPAATLAVEAAVKTDLGCNSFEFVGDIPGRSLHYTYNEDCFRGDPATHNRAKPRGVKRIMMIGDSTVSCNGVDDAETVPAYLEKFLGEARAPSGAAYQVINAGRAGATAKRVWMTVEDKLLLYSPDLVLYYSAINDGQPDPWIDKQIADMALGNGWLARIHKRFYYRSMMYTYAVEKFWLVKQQQRMAKTRYRLTVRDDFEPSFQSILGYTAKHHIPLVIVKQVIREPTVIGSTDTLNPAQIETLYMQRSVTGGTGAGDTELEASMAINQRYILAREESMARAAGVPVIDFVRLFDREVPKTYFADIVHLHAEGNERVARYLAGALGPYVK